MLNKDQATWQAISEAELQELIAKELSDCSQEQKELFAQYSVPIEKHRIERFGKTETVFVVAIKDGEALYYEDVEDGWNFSPLQPVLEHRCEQHELKHALQNWVNK